MKCQEMFVILRFDRGMANIFNAVLLQGRSLLLELP
jgi:hypothetical protein